MSAVGRGSRATAVSVAHKLATRTARLSDHKTLARPWNRLWDWVSGQDEDVEYSFYGLPFRSPASAVYDVYARRWETYNDPFVGLAVLTAKALGRSVRVIDVGAAMGDSAVLLHAAAGDLVSTVLCIEGHPGFADYLRHNTAQLPDVRIVETMLSDGPSSRSLVVSRVGTAAPTGEGESEAKTLDSVVSQDLAWDVVKVDVDGYDGRVLAGARDLLETSGPSVIFEWDPVAYVGAGSDPLQPFEVLEKAGYETFVWFDKYGRFSHFTGAGDRELVSLYEDFCRWTDRTDWHYDVAALHASSGVSPTELADLRGVRERKPAR